MWFSDGFDSLNHVAYQFHGCYWHGCPTHHPNGHTSHDNLAAVTMEDKYQMTLCNKELLCQAGYTVHTMWVCEWPCLKKKTRE